MMLDGRVALVTGAGRGIGRAVAAALAAAGARVFLTARTEAELRDAAERIAATGAAAAHAPADVSSSEDVDAVVAACESAFGPVDILVNAAGAYGPIGPTWEIDADAWWRAHEVNVRGTLLTCRAVLPAMIAAGRGRIINFSGGGATAPLPRFSAYASSKAAVVRLTETLAEEVRGYGVTVNAIAPGAVDTRLQDEVLEAGARAGELYERIRRLRASGEGGVPPELPASLAVFLASDAAAELTGKLVSAPHDGWKSWSADRIAELGGSAWLTIRRLDPFTIRPLLASMPAADA
jgi:NAD(P)-dependent dehydrogenase (short-subunit alcohol dehydrogenase family)